MEHNEPLIKKLQVIIHWSVRTLAILMVFVIVMATALMAIARKVIILDLDNIEPEYLWGIASGGVRHQHRLLAGGQAATFRS